MKTKELDDFFKEPSQDEIDRQFLTQLCYDGQMDDSEIEEFVETIISWKNKSMQQYADQQSVWFGTWYSGMDSEKVQSAYNRFLKEQGKFKQAQQPLKP